MLDRIGFVDRCDSPTHVPQARRAEALARAFCGTIEELARREKVNRGYMSQLLRLTLLAPDILEMILDGRQPEGMRLEDLLDGFPLAWASPLFGERRR